MISPRRDGYITSTSPIKHDYQARARPEFPTSPRKLVSPTKVRLPPSPTREDLLSPPPTHASSLAESSFMMPANMSESLIGDTSMPTLLMDDSLDFAMPITRAPLESVRRDRAHGRSVAGSTTEIKVEDKGSVTPTRTIRKPPVGDSAARARSTAPTIQVTHSSTPGRSQDRSPAKFTTPSTSRTKRTFPASSSHTTLSRLGERPHLHADVGDISTLLPTSPARVAHLTTDEHQLLRESLPFEGPSFFLPPPPSSTRKSPRKPNKADMTLDINDLMAKMAKPKRPSGTEESFEDLLNGPGPDFDQ